MFTQLVSCTLGALLVIGLVFLVAFLVFGYAVNSMVLYRSLFRVGNPLDENLSLSDLFTLCKRLLVNRFEHVFEQLSAPAPHQNKMDSSTRDSEKRADSKLTDKGTLSDTEPGSESGEVDALDAQSESEGDASFDAMRGDTRFDAMRGDTRFDAMSESVAESKGSTEPAAQPEGYSVESTTLSRVDSEESATLPTVDSEESATLPTVESEESATLPEGHSVESTTLSNVESTPESTSTSMEVD